MITLTAPAAQKAAELKQANGGDELALRIAVQPGGCAGLRYQLFFDAESKDGDHETTFDTNVGQLRVVVDRMSAPYLETAVIDFVETIDQIGFKIENDAAKGSCACGDSFN